MRVSRRSNFRRCSAVQFWKLSVQWCVLCMLAALSHPSSALSLKEVVQQALRIGPSINAEVNERRAREEEVKQARAGYFPRLDVILGYGRENTDNPSTRNVTGGDRWLTRREASLEARQMLFDGFATRSEVERQSARVNSAVFRTQDAAENKALRSVEVFVDVLKQEQLIALAMANLETHETIHGLIAARTEGGKGRAADLYQVDGRLALARANVEAEKGNLENSRARYREVVGEPAPDVGVLERPAELASLPNTEEEAVQIALDSHPILKSASSDIDATRAQHEAAKSPYYPRVDLELSAGLNDDLDGVEGRDDHVRVMVRLRYNLFRGGADVARRGQTGHLINEAKDIRASTIRQVIESAELSWRANESTNARMQYLIAHRDSSEKARDAYEEQFRLGTRSLLDRLDAENEFFEARRSVVSAEYDQLFSQYRIVGSMGRLRQELGLGVVDEGTTLELPDYITASGSEMPAQMVSDTAAQEKMLTAASEANRAGIQPAIADTRAISPGAYSDADSELFATLTAWADAWSRQDVNNYLSFYDSSFSAADGSSRTRWERMRKRRLEAPEYIQVSLIEPQLISNDGRKAEVELVQDYASDRYQDRVRKRVSFVRRVDGWKIASEVALSDRTL